MSGRLDDAIEGDLHNLLHHEPCRLGLLLCEGYALAMRMCMIVLVSVRELFILIMQGMSIMLVIAVLRMLRVVMGIRFVRMFRMIVFMFFMILLGMRFMYMDRVVVIVVVIVALSSPASGKKHRCTQTSQSRESFCHIFIRLWDKDTNFFLQLDCK